VFGEAERLLEGAARDAPFQELTLTRIGPALALTSSCVPY
jgi:hypothetical protein